MHSRTSHILKSVLPVLMIAAGCSDDFQHPGSFRPGAGGVAMSYTVFDNTRGIEASSEEKAVAHAYFLFFSKEGSLLAYTRAEDDPENPGFLKFDLPAELEENMDYSLVAIANADEYTPEDFEDYGKYLDSFSGSGLTITSPELLLHASSPIERNTFSYLPMTAALNGSESFSFSRRGGKFVVNGQLGFHRVVARIDVGNKIADGFRLHSLGLCNWRDSYAPLSPDYEAGNIRGIPTEENPDCALIDYVPTGDGMVMGPAFYAFPSKSENPKPGDKTTAAIMLNATYADDDSPSFYRVNIGGDGESSEIKANARYNLSLRSVKGSGKPTLLEAYESEEEPPIESDVELVLNPDAGGDYAQLVDLRNPTDTKNGSIVIDGFYPESFNSFIDIPLKLQIHASENAEASATISTTLEWPLEGAIAGEKLRPKYVYCEQSFSEKKVCSVTNDTEILNPEFPALSVSNGDTFFISAGAMAPDDPPIPRTLTVTVADKTLTYDITVRPRPVIINDVIINLNDEHFLVADRNYQKYEGKENKFSNWNNGVKTQAYYYCSFTKMKIPFKSTDEKDNEAFHGSTPSGINGGYRVSASQITQFQKSIGNWKIINQCDEITCQSPFYTITELDKWKPAHKALYAGMADKMSVSKMRIFLISDVPAKLGNMDIPICCYFPYFDFSENKFDKFHDKNTTPPEYQCGYFRSLNKGDDYNKIYLFCMFWPGLEKVDCDDVGSKASQAWGWVRPARELTESELENYRNNYLGYGGPGTLRQLPCMPDYHIVE